MGTVRYTTVNGKIIAEKRNGVRSRYISDSLGSTVALLDNTQTKTDTFEYWPYGEVRNRTGTNPTPFQHVGTLGYYKDSASRTQVRARELDNQKTRWMTQDPIRSLGGDYNLYRYAADNPTTLFDPSGLQPDPGVGTLIPCPKEVREAKETLCRRLRRLNAALNTDPWSPPDCASGIAKSNCTAGFKEAQCLLNWCSAGGGNVYCIKDTSANCKGACAFSFGRDGEQDPTKNVYLCYPAILGPACAYTHAIGASCKSQWIDSILHEMFHLCGEPQGGASGFSTDPAENRAQCLCGKMGL